MGVYIKGMKMPKNCDECNFSLDCPHDQHQDGYKMIGGRPNSCPMVEVSTPHGRLIDADSLKEKMKIVTRTAVQEIIEYDRNAYKVDDAPTIIGAEE